tara:strand:- start:924 stop:1307 length:384 start_codon:yes stop_codon:yes gene_type:complete
MIKLTEAADQLNAMLKADQLDKTKLGEIARELDQIPGLRVKLVDFEKYNEKELELLTAEKLVQIKNQNFEAAANAREQERECIKYANFQKYFQLKNSFFYPEENKLFYFHLGTEKNDMEIKTFLFQT